MMTWKQRNEEERFYRVDKWIWNADTEEYDRVNVKDELTLQEAKDIFKSIKINETCEQVDVYEEHEYTVYKIAVKDERFPNGTWDVDEI